MAQKNSGITLLELMIVISVVLILAVIGVQQSSGLQKLLQFNNAFQKTVFLVQRTRTEALALTEKSMVIALNNANGRLTRYLDENGNMTEDTDENKETYQLQSVFAASPQIDGVSCGNPAQIAFEAGTGKVRFFCGTGVTSEIQNKILTIELCQLAAAGGGTPSLCPPDSVRKKSFIIHKASGVPQVQ